MQVLPGDEFRAQVGRRGAAARAVFDRKLGPAYTKWDEILAFILEFDKIC